MLRRILFALSILVPMAAAAESVLPSVAVQNRKYTHTHEFTVSVGTLPMDAFTKGVTASGAYTLHFNDTLAWEVGQFFYSVGVDTELEAELLAFDLKPTPFERVEQFVTSNVVFKPLYWKGAWLNDGLGYGEFFLVGGGGYGWLTRTQRPVVNLGLGFRVYLHELVSVKFDLRHLSFIAETDTQNELWLGLGISLSP
jgi:outer membrane beta-barrel protein